MFVNFFTRFYKNDEITDTKYLCMSFFWGIVTFILFIYKWNMPLMHL